ncbi:MAG TPA: AraC family transcriptional regulator [Candidatus Tumulicola sp.]
MQQSDLLGTPDVSRSLEAGLRFTTTQYRPASALPPHEHASTNITFVRHGHYRETFEKRERWCEPDMLIVHPAGERHSNVHGPSGVRLLNVEFDPARARLLNDIAPVLQQPFEQRSNSYSRLANAIETELHRNDDASSLALESLVLEAFVTAFCDRVSNERNHKWLSRVVDALHETTERRISMDDLANVAGVHPVHVAREFRRTFRCTVAGYLRVLRARRACEALATSDLPLSTIAQSAGFSDQSHFTRVFRATIGISPGAYRQTRKR